MFLVSIISNSTKAYKLFNFINKKKEKAILENQLKNLEQNINQNENYFNTIDTELKASENTLKHNHSSGDLVNGKLYTFIFLF